MLNEAFKLLRILNDLSIKDMAEKIELSEAYISELETRKKGNPSMEVIRKYANYFSVHPSDILLLSENLNKDIGNNIRRITEAFTIFCMAQK
jgi:transcriptional regulator with XRE-family HTH domain